MYIEYCHIISSLIDILISKNMKELKIKNLVKMKSNIIIETKNLTKFYGKSRGIENLNLKIHKGEIFGLLGPNGAGKTTTIRVLLDIIRSTSGEAKIFNLDIFKNSLEIRQKVAYLPGELGLYKDKTARWNLKHLLSMYDAPIPTRRIEELADRLNLDLDVKKVKELSKGNKQKIGIVLVLAPNVDLLILDEPTSGLDPLIMTDFYNMLYEQQKETEITVLLSSHRLEEVERVAHRVGVIREGTLVEEASIDQLKKMALKEVLVEYSAREEVMKLKERLPASVHEHKRNGLKKNQLLITVSRDELKKVLKILSESDLKDLEVSSPALEDIFIKYYETKKAKMEVV